MLPVDEATAAPHTAHREMVTELDWYRGLGTPIKLRRTPGGTRRPPPKFAQDGAEVLAQHGYTAERDRGAATRRRPADRTPQIAAEPANTRTTHMPEAALPAREMLKLSGQTTVAWAAFDAAWYLAVHPDARVELNDANDAAVLRFYLEHGQQRGHSPNIWFDEAWHMKVHPGAAAAVREGHAESGFDSLLPCRVPHPLAALAVPGDGVSPAPSRSAR